jgi:hypothetical protein
MKIGTSKKRGDGAVEGEPGDEDGENGGGVQQAVDREHAERERQPHAQDRGPLGEWLLICPAKAAPRQPPHQQADRHAGQELAHEDLVQPVDHRRPRLPMQQRYRQHDEQESKAVVRSALGRDGMAQPARHAAIGALAGDDAVGEDRIGRRQHGADQKRQQQRQPHDEIDQGAARQPHERHAQRQHDRELAPVPELVGVRQTQGGAHDRDGQRDAGGLAQERVLILAREVRIDEIQDERAERDADREGNGGLREPEPVLDVARHESQQQDDAGAEREGDVEVVHRSFRDS